MRRADVAILTKMDLAEVIEFDEEVANRNIQAVRPAMKVFKVSAKTGAGMNEYLEFLAAHRGNSRAAAPVENDRRSVAAG